MLNTEAFVLESEKEAENFVLPMEKKSSVSCLRRHLITRNLNDLVEILAKKGYDIHCFKYDLQCDRGAPDRSPSEIATEVDAMIVIGGRHSSNTQKLFEICKQECENTYYIQSLDDLDVHSSTIR